MSCFSCQCTLPLLKSVNHAHIRTCMQPRSTAAVNRVHLPLSSLITTVESFAHSAHMRASVSCAPATLFADYNGRELPAYYALVCALSPYACICMQDTQSRFRDCGCTLNSARRLELSSSLLTHTMHTPMLNCTHPCTHPLTAPPHERMQIPRQQP
jgi:hypothetical protein